LKAWIIIFVLGVLIYGANHSNRWGPSDGSIESVATVRLPVGPAEGQDVYGVVGRTPTPTPTSSPTASPTPVYPTLSPVPPVDSGVSSWVCQPQYRWPCNEALSIVRCESGGDPTAYNPSGATGLFQMMMPLWTGLMHGGDPYDPYVNTQAAYELWLQSGGSWYHWACQP